MTRVTMLLVVALGAPPACMVAASPPTTSTTPLAQPVKPEQVTGHWSSEPWGDMYFDVQPDGTAHGVYPHDLGAVTGKLGEDGVFRGWWCEAPSRQPDGDAGDVEFRFVRADDGHWQLDGHWRYGTTGEWHE